MMKNIARRIREAGGVTLGGASLSRVTRPALAARGPRGFALLVAVIISSVALAIGATLASIAYKQVLLASSAQDSTSSFYAADAGLECALYWDQQYDAFDYTKPSSSITCGGTSAAISFVSKTAATSTVSFHWPINAAGPCVDVTVAKNVSGRAAIYSVGHNTCDLADPRLIERGLDAEY